MSFLYLKFLNGFPLHLEEKKSQFLTVAWGKFSNLFSCTDTDTQILFNFSNLLRTSFLMDFVHDTFLPVMF